jgi:AcrR family transcriptional regulator
VELKLDNSIAGCNNGKQVLACTIKDMDMGGMKGKGTRQRILEAAVEVGSRLGYAQATTKAIADAAGVNEVTLFRHFGTKDNLFSEAIEQFGGPALAPMLEQQMTGDYRQDLMTYGRVVFTLLLERRDILQLVLCESTNIPEVRTVLARNPEELRRALANYLQSQMAHGIVRKGHPELLAQAFMGMFFAYAISLNILESAIEPPVSEGQFVESCVDLFFAGTIKQDTSWEASR